MPKKKYSLNFKCKHKNRPKVARGFCKNCYQVWYYHNLLTDEARQRNNKYKRETAKKRYWSDSAFREKSLKAHRKYSLAYFKKKVKENPGWNAERQREWRKKHPESFNCLMLRFYGKRVYKLNKKRFYDIITKIRENYA